MNKPSDKMTVCICPMCGKRHKQKIMWTGNGTPRVYCWPCAGYVSRHNIGAEDVGAGSRTRPARCAL